MTNKNFKVKHIEKKMLKPKKQITVSQMALIFSWIVVLIWISMSYILVWCGKDSNTDVTIGVITYGLSAMISYFISKTVEKNSTNKYKTDNNGVPYEIAYRNEYANISNGNGDSLDNENYESDTIEDEHDSSK